MCLYISIYWFHISYAILHSCLCLCVFYHPTRCSFEDQQLQRLSIFIDHHFHRPPSSQTAKFHLHLRKLPNSIFIDCYFHRLALSLSGSANIILVISLSHSKSQKNISDEDIVLGFNDASSNTFKLLFITSICRLLKVKSFSWILQNHK